AIGITQLAFMLGSGMLHSFYFILLDKGYQVGDLSIVYPLARGTGPLISTLVAIVYLGERPSLVALAGALLIGVGVFTLTGNPAKLKEPEARKPVLFALLCGTAIASYTIWDKLAVSTYRIPPLIEDWAPNVVRVLLLTPYAVRNWGRVTEEWQIHKAEAIGVAALCPLSYILVLTAMAFSPVSYIAPARESSILIGTVMGTRLLSEGNVRAKLLGASAIVLGIVALSAG
ncbi:MAG: EamA family transporter, partial [Desulfofundulus sp.]